VPQAVPVCGSLDLAARLRPWRSSPWRGSPDRWG